VKRAIGGTLLLALGVPVVLMVRPLLYRSALKAARRWAPEVFDPALFPALAEALAAVEAALHEDGYG
jgi:hypothetical protein